MQLTSIRPLFAGQISVIAPERLPHIGEVQGLIGWNKRGQVLLGKTSMRKKNRTKAVQASQDRAN